MYWHRWTTLAALFLAFAALAAWQWDEYGHECELARETVASSADSVMNALVGGIRSHRRLGQFFLEQVQEALDELARSKDVRAVALVSDDGQTVLSAGDHQLLNLASEGAPGEYWDETGYRLVNEFRLPADISGPGGGRGGGLGGGRGWGRRWQIDEEDEQGSFGPGHAVTAILVVDRSRADTAYRRAAWTRGVIVVAGWLVVLCVALAWRATVRLAEARGHARTLEVEARHFRDLSQAAAGLAHETRNPLGLIRGWTQRLAENGMDGSDGRRKVQAVIEECDRVTARINQFLAFARPSEPRPEPFDPAELIGELAALLEPDLSGKRLTLARPELGIEIVADREMLRQILFNLLQNAIHASPEDAAVETSISRARNGRVRIEVSDRGPGVPAEFLNKLFTPYFTTRVGGTGLGLAIVRRIAAAHGWEVGHTPRRGGGAVFWLEGIHG
jgi:two-component system, NtrC family, sensor histidine kinase HydH